MEIPLEHQEQISTWDAFMNLGLSSYNDYIIRFLYDGVPIPANELANRQYYIEDFILKVKTLMPDFDFDDYKAKGRMLIGCDHISTVNGNPIIPELIGKYDIFVVAVNGVVVSSIPTHNPVTGELNFSVAIGDKLRITYKPI